MVGPRKSRRNVFHQSLRLAIAWVTASPTLPPEIPLATNMDSTGHLRVAALLVVG